MRMEFTLAPQPANQPIQIRTRGGKKLFRTGSSYPYVMIDSAFTVNNNTPLKRGVVVCIISPYP